MKKLLSLFLHLKPTKWCLAFLLVFGLGVLGHKLGMQDLLSLVEQAFAGSPTGAPGASTTTATGAGGGLLGGIGQVLGNVISGIATLLIKLLSGIIYFVLYWIPDLMDNTFILEGDIGEKLRSVWVIVRNFVNILFAIILVGAALMSVIGYGDEGGNYAMKKFIPKMALALIAVNFTFLACRLVLDLNNVITTAIFAIPRSVTTITDIGPSGTANTRIFKKFKCLDSTLTADQALQQASDLDRRFPGVINSLGGVCFADPPAQGETAETLATPTAASDRTKQAIIRLGASEFSRKDFVWVMATQFQGLNDLNKVSQLTNPTFENLTVNALFSIIFAVIYATAYIAMFIILLARMVVLWICIMLSPLVAISIAVPDFLPSELDIQDMFLKHAFVPAKMAVPISFGYILISQMTLSINTGAFLVADKPLDLTAGGEFARGISITTLMYGAASVAVIWMGVFAASKDVVGHGMVENVKGFVEGVGTTVAKWPTYLPIIPVPGGGGIASLSTIKMGITEAQNAVAELQRQRDQRIVQTQLDRLGLGSSQLRDALRNIEDMVARKRYDSARATDIRTVAASDDEARFTSLVQTMSRSDTWENDTERRNVAQAFGYADGDFSRFQNDVRDPTRVREMRERFRTQGGGTTPPSTTADYSAIATGTLANRTATVDLSRNEIWSSMTAETRASLGLGDTPGAFSLNENVNMAEFMGLMRDTSKIRNPVLLQFVRSDLLQNVVSAPENAALRTEMAKDTALINRLLGLKSTNTGDNQKIRAIIGSILQITDDARLTARTGIQSTGALNP